MTDERLKAILADADEADAHPVSGSGGGERPWEVDSRRLTAHVRELVAYARSLRTGLQPFAEYVEFADKYVAPANIENDDRKIGMQIGNALGCVRITYGDCRRAAELLNIRGEKLTPPVTESTPNSSTHPVDTAAVLADADRYDRAYGRAIISEVTDQMRAVVAELEGERAKVKELQGELQLWKPMTPDEAERALNEAKAVPLSEERISEIVKRATDPAERVTNCEQAQLAVEVERMKVELEGEKKANALLNAGMGGVCEGRDELKHKVRDLEAKVVNLRAALSEFKNAWDTATSGFDGLSTVSGNNLEAASELARVTLAETRS